MNRLLAASPRGPHSLQLRSRRQRRHEFRKKLGGPEVAISQLTAANVMSSAQVFTLASVLPPKKTKMGHFQPRVLYFKTKVFKHAKNYVVVGANCPCTPSTAH